MAAMKGVFFSCMIVLLITACLGSPHERNTRTSGVSKVKGERSLGQIVRRYDCLGDSDCHHGTHCVDGYCRMYG
uniref:Putative drillipeptide CvEx14.3 n=1 Tax=Clavus sp. n. QL-2020 TaxID=2720206 RepID=A0A6M3HB14_9CAEN|nr:putative drillipeptide precursor CvEx14.3 [Clavus sp. n. QL-2020]